MRLRSVRRAKMIAPPTHPLDEPSEHAGFWFTLEDKAGKPLYRRVIHPPMQFDQEVFSPEPSGNITRQAIAQPTGTFELIVPDVPNGHAVALKSSPLEPHGIREPARALARFELAVPPNPES